MVSRSFGGRNAIHVGVIHLIASNRDGGSISGGEEGGVEENSRYSVDDLGI